MINVDWIIPLDGWILQQMAERTIERADAYLNITLCHMKPSGKADIEHYGLYHLMRERRVPSSAYFTHKEPEDHPLHQRWNDVSEMADVCITSADMYAEMLPNARVILPGVDEKYKPRRLRVGSAFQLAHGNEYRKGYDLLQRLQAEHGDWIDLRLTLGQIDDMVAWYQDLDVYLVSSRYEGIPMPALEAAACGLLIVAPKDVGLMEYLHQHIEFESYMLGSYDGMVRTLRDVHQRITRCEQRRTIENLFNWDTWAYKHFEIFKELAK